MAPDTAPNSDQDRITDTAAGEVRDGYDAWKALDAQERATAAPCVFCERIKAHEFDIQWTDAVAFEPLNPVTPGHMLIVSRFHVADATVDAATTALTMKWASYYANDIDEDCNLITSCGPAATQTIRHLHVHVVPRREGDGLHLPWTGQEVADSPEATQRARMLADIDAADEDD